MLPWSLATYRIRRGRVFPVFRDLSGQNWGLAQRVIDAFKSHVGKSRKELEEKLEELTITPSYKFVKGLIKIMERRTIYEEGEDAIEFRMKVFKRYPEIPEIRARELGISVDELLRKMFSDLNPTILKVLDIGANELILEYNLSLAQTMLFKATMMEAQFSDARVYSSLKHFGLIYTMPTEQNVLVDGPASLFSQTTRYGTRFAKLLPYIVARAPWRIRAPLKLKDEEVIFEMDHLRHAYYFPRRVEEIEDEIELEARGCKVEKFHRPVKVGEEYFIPNYRIICWGGEFYVEIFKFWTWSYIEERVEKAKNAGVPIIFFLQSEGDIKKEGKKSVENVFFFRNRIRDEDLRKALKEVKFHGKEIGDEPEERNRKIEELRIKLEGVEDYREAEQIIEEEGLPVMETLHTLGYRVIWRGLEPYKIKKR